MHQFSVYIRYCGSLESAQVHIKRVKSFTPEKGHVSVLSITDKQYSNIIHIWGAIEKKTSQPHCNWNFFSIFADEEETFSHFVYVLRAIIHYK